MTISEVDNITELPTLFRAPKGAFLIHDKNGNHLVRPPFYVPGKIRQLKGRSAIIGYIGSRGGGKTANAVKEAIISHMLKGKTVWSNVEIAFNVSDGKRIYTLRSKPFDKMEMRDLDKLYSDGLILIDEVNMEFADSRQSMSKGNITFSFILQQLRKRRLNIIWTAQSEMHCDSRLRWQTDVFIKCADASIGNPKVDIGAYTKCTYFDLSGIVKGTTPKNNNDAIFKRLTVMNKPWWNFYDTLKLQGIAEESEEVDEEREEVTQMAGEMYNFMLDNPRVLPKKLWELWGVTKRREQIIIGTALSGRGIRRGGNQNKYYILDDVGIAAP